MTPPSILQWFPDILSPIFPSKLPFHPAPFKSGLFHTGCMAVGTWKKLPRAIMFASHCPQVLPSRTWPNALSPDL